MYPSPLFWRSGTQPYLVFLLLTLVCFALRIWFYATAYRGCAEGGMEAMVGLSAKGTESTLRVSFDGRFCSPWLPLM